MLARGSRLPNETYIPSITFLARVCQPWPRLIPICALDSECMTKMRHRISRPVIRKHARSSLPFPPVAGTLAEVPKMSMSACQQNRAGNYSCPVSWRCQCILNGPRFFPPRPRDPTVEVVLLVALAKYEVNEGWS